jgi:FAD/FMN-containing dehydrogenase
VDLLKSVRIVTGRGDIVNASQTENADLFWGIRGAGANFGIITSATFEVFDATNGGQVMNADFRFPATAFRSLFQTFASSLPSKLALTGSFGFNRTSNEVSLTNRGKLTRVYGMIAEDYAT